MKNSSLRSIVGSQLVLLLMLAIGNIVVLSSVPPASRDALTHHLFIPKLYLMEGRIFELPEYIFSYYPMNIDLLYMIPLYFNNDVIPKYIHFFFALMTAFFICQYLTSRTTRLWGLAGALYFLTIPAIIKLSVTAYVDLGLIAFTFASLVMLFKWAEKQFNLKYLLLSGCFCGLAAGCKYNGLVSLFILTVLVVFIYIRSSVINGNLTHQSSKAIGYCLIFLSIAILCFSPWLIRNYYWTGNPLYPLYNSVFAEKNTDAIAKVNDTDAQLLSDKLKGITSMGSGTFASRKQLYGETWLDIILLPVRFFYEGRDDDPQYFDGKLTPLLLILPVFAFWGKNVSRRCSLEMKILVWFSLLYFFLVFFQQAMRIRWISPILPALSVLSVLGLKNLFEIGADSVSKQKRFAAALVIVVCVAFMISHRGTYVASLYKKIQPVPYLTGSVSREEYISAHVSEYPIVKYANTYLPRESTVLGVFIGNRGYYFNNKILFDLVNGQSRLVQATRNAESSRQVANFLKEQGITHLLIRHDLFNKYMNSELVENEKTRFNMFLNNYVVKLHEINNHGLYRIVSE